MASSFDPPPSDLDIIRDVLSVQHIPVVASLHWDKLQSILLSLCDRIASQALRLDKAEEQGRNFMSFKDEVDQLFKNVVKEVKETNESELEQQQNWSRMIEERLQNIQQGLDANHSSMKQLSDDVAELQHVDVTLQSLTPRLDALEQAAKESLEVSKVPQPEGLSLESLNEKIEVLLAEFEEQNEKLHSLEEQNQQLKLLLQQGAKAQASDLESLQQYCRNLRSDFEMKFLVDVGKLPTIPEGELSPETTSKLEVAVAEIQNRMNKKADIDSVDRLSQLKRFSTGSRRASRLSLSTGQDNQVGTGSLMNMEGLFEARLKRTEEDLMDLATQLSKKADRTVMDEVQFKLTMLGNAEHTVDENNGGEVDNHNDDNKAMKFSSTALQSLQDLMAKKADRDELLQLHKLVQGQRGGLLLDQGNGTDFKVFAPETKPKVTEELSPEVVEVLTKDLRSAIKNYDIVLSKLHEDLGALGKSILVMSGHEGNVQVAADVTGSDNVEPESNGEKAPEDPMQGHPPIGFVQKPSFGSKVALLDDTIVVQAIHDGLKMNRFEPKENTATIAKVLQELLRIAAKVNELDSLVPSLNNGLLAKADRLELQRFARYVKDQLERPENALLTGKPLYGFKCMSCEHPLEKLCTVPAERAPTNRMPPQILPMLSAERIFSFDKRLADGRNISPPQSPGRNSRPWTSYTPNVSSGIGDMVGTKSPNTNRGRQPRSNGGTSPKNRVKNPSLL